MRTRGPAAAAAGLRRTTKPERSRPAAWAKNVRQRTVRVMMTLKMLPQPAAKDYNGMDSQDGAAMSNTERYRVQHAEIARLAGDLKRHLNPVELGGGADKARAVLAELGGKLFVHLAAEDKVLYPQLLKSADTKMQELARRFLAEMQPISAAFKSFSVRWGNTRAIQSNVEAFIAESRQILAALEQRIRREHEELYSLADKLQLTAQPGG